MTSSERMEIVVVRMRNGVRRGGVGLTIGGAVSSSPASVACTYGGAVCMYGMVARGGGGSTGGGNAGGGNAGVVAGGVSWSVKGIYSS